MYNVVEYAKEEVREEERAKTKKEIERTLLRTALEMLKEGDSIEKVQRITHLTLAQIIKLRKEMES